MSEMMSFYGGRQGSSFIIVKRFDGIDIPQPGDGSGATEYTYTANNYAVDQSNNFIITTEEEGGNVVIDSENNKYLIAKTSKNQLAYSWKRHDNDGSIINETEYTFPRQLAEGMVQCFARGGETASEVNYGEYVLIDTLLNMKEVSNLDNGKVFRRGLDLNSELAGAEYIGQIVGPQGESPEISLDKEGNIKSIIGSRTEKYSVEDEDLIPGYYVEGYNSDIYLGTYTTNVVRELLNNVESPQEGTLYKVTNGNTQTYEYYSWSAENSWKRETPSFNDKVSFSWVTLRDPSGNVYGCLLGFTIPYLVQNFTATSVSAYYNKNEQGELITNRNLVERTDDRTHGFYQSWNIKVPEGIRGNTTSRIECIFTEIKKHTLLYADPTFQYPMAQLWESYPLETDTVNYNLPYIPVDLGGDILYAENNPENGDKYVLRYTETDYHRRPEGDNRFVTIGPYNTIKKLWIDDSGDVYVEYSYNGVEKISSSHLKWVSSMVIQQNGHYVITYNDETTDEGDLNFIDQLTIENDGTVKYFYSNNHTTPAGTQEQLIRWIDEIGIDGNDGNGTQKVTVTYNHEVDGSRTKTIGDPLNYILETVITESSADSPNTPPYHLLVLYSDPERRLNLPVAERATYLSKYPDQYGNYLRDDWHDLGNIRGAKGSLGVLTELANVNLLKDDSANHVNIPPEYLLEAASARKNGGSYIHNPPLGLDSQYMGWMVYVDNGNPTTLVDLYFYDYDTEDWVKVAEGVGGHGGANPEEVVRIGSTAPDSLKEYGIWFVLTSTKGASL